MVAFDDIEIVFVKSVDRSDPDPSKHIFHCSLQVYDDPIPTFGMCGESLQPTMIARDGERFSATLEELLKISFEKNYWIRTGGANTDVLTSEETKQLNMAMRQVLDKK